MGNLALFCSKVPMDRRVCLFLKRPVNPNFRHSEYPHVRQTPNAQRSTFMNPEDLEKLVTWRMPFGKHAGRLLADLPSNYLHWFARVGFPEGELGRLLNLMREIDHNGLSALLDPLRAPTARPR